jgi:hypothetical protein
MANLPIGLTLGTAVWREGAAERRAMVAPLPGEPGRLVDLNRVEQVRLAKLGEGRAAAMADALVPSSLRQLLEAGPRGIQRAAQTLAYAAKWSQRQGLPEELGPPKGSYSLLACLPRPLTIRTGDGQFLDRLCVQGPGATLPAISEPTIAIVGSTQAKYVGCCIAAGSPLGPVLGAWLHVGELPEGEFSIRIGGFKRSMPTNAWSGLRPPRLRPAEVLLLPPPALRLPASISLNEKISIETCFELLELFYSAEPMHPMVQ